MKGNKRKRLNRYLILALTVITVSAIFVGFFTANAAVTSVTINFGSVANGGNYTTYYDSTKSEATATDRYNASSGARTDFVVQDRSAYGTDPNIFFKFPNGISVEPNYILCVKYAIMSAEYDTGETGSAEAFLFTGNATDPYKTILNTGSGITLGYNYSENGSMKYRYAVLGYSGTIHGVRLDIPHTVKANTKATVAIQEIYIGPPSGAPEKFTITYKNAAGTVIGTQSLGYNDTPTYSGDTPTKATVAKQYQYTFNNTWKNVTANKTGLKLADQRITGNTEYQAEYKVSKVYATFKGRNPDTGAEGYVIKEYWVNYNTTPTAPTVSTVTAGDYRYVPKATLWSPSLGKLTGPVTFTAQYDTYYKVTFLGYDKNGEYNTVLKSDYVKHGDAISTVFTSLPTVSTVYQSGDAATGTKRYVQLRTANKWINVGETGESNETGATISGIEVRAPRTVKARYQTEYAVRYISEGTALSEIDWVINDSKLQLQNGEYTDFKFNGTLPTSVDSNKAFVGWVRSTSSAANAVDSGTAQVPGSGGISAATYFHARYLDKTFTGSDYSYSTNTPGIVVTREVKAVDKDAHKYRIVIEAYSYGKPLGYFDIVDSLDGNFYIVEEPNIRVYQQAYAGNGKFASSRTEISAGGGNGYVWHTESDHTGYDEFDNGVFKIKYDGEAAGAVKTAYYYIRWLNNASGSTTVDDFRTIYGLNEVGNKGYKLIVEIDAYLDRPNTIGGNNMLISNPDKAYVKYVASKNSKTFNWDNGSGLKNNDKVNANVQIQYDFVPHDYYMDLYDVQKNYYNYRRSVKSTENSTYIGLISVLRNLSQTNGEGLNHEKIYSNMFTHGNEPFYVYQGYYDDGTPNYNTDCDGVHNAWVNITYDVIHEDKGNVYSTVIYYDKNNAVVQTKGATFTSGSSTITLVNGRYPTNYVDFTKDHMVQVRARVYPRTTNTDSFGRKAYQYADINGTDRNYWEKQTESYFFAPRFAVVDYSTTTYTSLQRESQVHDGDFKVTKSVINGSNTSTLSRRSSGAVVPAKIYYHKENNATKNASDLIYYSFDSNNAFVLAPTSQRMLSSIEKTTYTTKVINTPKRMAADEVNGTKAKGTIQRNFYVIPANVIAFDDRALTFLPEGTDTPKWLDGGTYKYYYQTSDVDTRETQGINATTATNTLYPVNRIHGNSNAATARTESYYLGQAKYAKVDGSKDENGDRLNQNQYGIFTFTGTGFDIISRTGPNTGVLVAAVYKGKLTEAEAKNATPIQNILVDTYLAGKELYQVPVIKYEAPSHGVYTVYFRAYYHEIFDHNLVKRGSRTSITEQQIAELLGWDASVPATIVMSEFGNNDRPATRTDGLNSYEVYIDGIRVYNTLGTLSAATGTGDILSTTTNAAKYAAYAAYNCGNILHSKGLIQEFVAPEANPTFFNVSDFLVDSGKSDWAGSLTGDNAVNGILYIAAPMPEDYVDDAGGQTGSNSGSSDGLIHAGFHLGMSGTLYTEESNGKYYVYRMKDADNNGTPDTKERVKHNGQDVYYKLENGKTVYYAGTTKLSDVEFFAACGQTVCYYDAKYDAIGPEHEIYLAKNSGVAMQIGTANTVHVGLRSLDGTAITVNVWNGTGWSTLCQSLKAKTETYFDATAAVKSAGGKLYLKVTEGNYASIVNIKLVGGTKPSVSTRMVMDALKLFGTAETPVDENLSLKHSLNLASDISMNYIATPDLLEGATDSWVTVRVPVYEGNERVGTQTVTLRPEFKNYVYYYTLDGLTAVHMNDTLEAELYVVRDGVTYVSETDTYSIATYAYGQLNKETVSPALRNLCGELLRYGACAQNFKNYRTDALADSQMTEAHRALLQDLSTITFGSNNAVLEDLEAPTALWSGKALDLGSKVAVKFIFGLNGYEGRVEDLTLSVTYTAIDGQERTVEISDPQLYSEAFGQYAFTFDGLLAAELRSVLYVRVCENGTPISQTMVYSPDTYGNGKTGALGELCKALFAYSDAAKDYFLQ